MALAGTLEIQMMANLARLSKDMAEAKGMVGGAMASIEKAAAGAQKMLGALGIGLSAGMFIGMIKNSIDAADKLNDLSKSTGLAVTQLAGLKLAATQSGGDLDSIADSINKLSVNIGKDGERFKALGITAKDPLQAFKQLSDIFVAIEDPQQRAAVAAAALGKSWAGAAPLLAEGGASIQVMVDEGARLSGMTQEMADGSDKFNDSIAKLQTQLGGIGTGLANSLLPTLIQVTKELNSFNSNGNGLVTFGEGINEVFKTLVVIGANIGYVFKQAGNEIGGMAAQLASVAKMDFKGAAAIRREMIADAAAARAEIDAFSERIMNPPKVLRDAANAAPAVDAKTAAEAPKRAAEFLKNAQDQQKAYDSLLNKINEYDAQILLELNSGKKLTEADKLAIAVKEKLTIVQQASLQAVLDKIKADEDALIDMREFDKLEALASGRRAEQNDALDKNLQSVIDDAKAMRENTAEIGLSADALTALKLARIDDTIAIEQRKLAILDNGFETEEIAKIRATITALKDLKTATNERDSALQNENAKAIGAAYSVSIVKGLKSGNIGQSILADIQDSFEKNVLEPQINAVVMKAMPLFEFKDGALLSNTAALQANTAAKSGSAVSGGSGAAGASSAGWWGLVVVAVAAIVSSLGSREHGITAAEIQSAQGSGTVLGDINAKAMSIANGIDTLNKYTFASSYFLRDMRDSLRVLNSSIRTMVEKSALGGFGANAAAGMGLYPGTLPQKATDRNMELVASVLGGNAASSGLADFFGAPRVHGFADKLNSMFYMRTSREINAQGVGVTGTLNQLQSGVGGYNYATGTDTSKGLLGLYKSSRAWRQQQTASDVSKLFGDTLSNVASVIKMFSVQVGADAATLNASIAAFVFSTGDINLQSMNVEQQIAALTSVLSKQSDLLVGALIPSMKEFQKSGEGLLDTLVRVATEVEMVKGFFKVLGTSIYSVWSSAGTDILGATRALDAFVEAIGGLDAANQKMSDFISNFADAGTKQNIAKDTLETLGLPLLNTVEAYFEYSKTATAEQLATMLNNQPSLMAWVDAIKANTTAALQLIEQNKDKFSTNIDYLRAVGHQENGVNIPINYGVASLPSYAVGTPYVPYDQIAQIHKGERITPAAANDELVIEIKALRQEVSMLRSSSDQTARSTKKTSDLLTNVTQDGQSLMTTAA